MSAVAGATGVRSWLQAQHLTWLTPRRMQRVTIALFAAAVGVSSIGLGGSTAPPSRAAQHAVVQPR